MLDVSKAKQEITAVIGETVDGLLEQSKAELQKWNGAQEGLKQAIKKTGLLEEHIDKDVEEGLIDFSCPEAALEYCKKTVTRAVEILDNLRAHAQVMSHVENGKIDAYKKAVKVVQNHHDSVTNELRQRVAYLQQLEAGTLETRTKKDGTESDLDKRRDEAAKAKRKPRRTRKKKEAE